MAPTTQIGATTLVFTVDESLRVDAPVVVVVLAVVVDEGSTIEPHCDREQPVKPTHSLIACSFRRADPGEDDGTATQTFTSLMHSIESRKQLHLRASLDPAALAHVRCVESHVFKDSITSVSSSNVHIDATVTPVAAPVAGDGDGMPVVVSSAATAAAAQHKTKNAIANAILCLILDFLVEKLR